ncbi:MAG: hypothetical protein ACJAVL_001843, partial [Bacteroidia bacterium]
MLEKDNSTENGLDFDSSNLILFVVRWKKPLLILSLAA